MNQQSDHRELEHQHTSTACKCKEELGVKANNVFHPIKGWVNPREVILHTGRPLYGMEHLGYVFFSQDESNEKHSLLNSLKGTLTMKMLLLLLNDYLHTDGAISEEDILSLRVCEHNLAIWLITFDYHGSGLHHYLQRVTDEEHGTAGTHPTSGDEASIGINNTLGSSILDTDDLQLLPQKGPFLDRGHPMAVGIIDRGAHNEDDPYFAKKGNGRQASGIYHHVDILARIIAHEGHVQPVSIPMVEDPHEVATVFDLICALSNHAEIDKVQVINISQGFYAAEPHAVLKKVLEEITKPIICSAGNDGSNNDEFPHWPSNFAASMEHVYAVSYIDERGNLGTHSNYGYESVTASARGHWIDDRLEGSSYSAAWASRMFALASSLESRANLTFDEVVPVVSELYNVTNDNPDPTISKVRLDTIAPVAAPTPV